MGRRSSSPSDCATPGVLTPPPDSFIGRGAEMVLLAERLERSRLVTVIGPAGVGKTRLCGHVVESVADRYPDGGWCCALASVTVQGQVAEAVAGALRVDRRAGMTLEERLVEFLATKAYYAGEVRLEADPDNASALLTRSLADAARLSSRLLVGAAGLSSPRSRPATGIPGRRWPAIPS